MEFQCETCGDIFHAIADGRSDLGGDSQDFTRCPCGGQAWELPDEDNADTQRISRKNAELIRSTRFHKTGTDDQFMRRIAIGSRMATVITQYCRVAGRYGGCVHLDGDPFNELVIASWS